MRLMTTQDVKTYMVLKDERNREDSDYFSMI